jgi:glutathione gamma-glutamylcysteinyltransferase
VDRTFYRRPLPAGAIAFSSEEGRSTFAEALAARGLDGYFRLAEQFHTQADPAFCGLGSLVVALNALAIDPGRLWKGPWRWFAEDLLDCCVPLEQVRARGLSLDELACLARCNGADVEVRHSAASAEDLGQFRRALEGCARGSFVLIASYDRAALGQTGSGHFSPVGGYHAARDLVLLLDVARFKYPPHWIPAEQLWRAMHPLDPSTGLSRGWLGLEAREHGLALGFSLRCTGESWQALSERIRSVARELPQAGDVVALARAVEPLSSSIELRTPTTSAHQEALARARTALRALPVYSQVHAALGDHGQGAERAEFVTLLLLASEDALTPNQRAALGPVRLGELLASELRSLTAQLAAVAGVTPPEGDEAVE